MQGQEITIHQASALAADTMEKVLVGGDLSKLAPAERVSYYGKTCESLGLNPLTKPFEYINLNGKLTLYAKRDATDQLRSLRKVSITIVSREKVGDVYAVTARATTPDGRLDESIGAVTVGNLKGDALANALMKAETKAKRRVTLSIVGLGWLDESEVDTIPNAQPIAPLVQQIEEAIAWWDEDARLTVLVNASTKMANNRTFVIGSFDILRAMPKNDRETKWLEYTLANVQQAKREAEESEASAGAA